MKLFRNIVGFMIVLAGIILVSESAFAQRAGAEQSVTVLDPSQDANKEGAQIPPVPQVDLSNVQTAPEFPKISFGESNPYFLNMMTVQYQNTLLKILTERQEKMADLKESFDKIGLQFNEPPPERRLCEELPPNRLCTRFYPNMYAAPSVPTEGLGGLGDFFKNVFSGGEGEAAPQQGASVEVAAEPEQTETPRPTYQWADIACLMGKCRAVIALQDRPAGSRRTVSVGDTINDDFVVKYIGFDGVRVAHPEHGTFKLKPFSKDISPSVRRAAMGGEDGSKAGNLPEITLPDGETRDVSAEKIDVSDVNPDDIDASLDALINDLDSDVIPQIGFDQ